MRKYAKLSRAVPGTVTIQKAAVIMTRIHTLLRLHGRVPESVPQTTGCTNTS